MKVLLLGSGGREHALAWKMNKSHLLDELFIAPGNGGTASLGSNVQLDIMDHNAVGDFCQAKSVDMVIVGPEAPLVNGIVDHFEGTSSLQHINILGPDNQSARLEGSKAFAKSFMEDLNIPTARYACFSAGELDQAVNYMEGMNTPIVLKADGLAAGKGVVICASLIEAKRELTEMLSGKFGKASQRVVIEEFLEGIEFSVFALTDGHTYKMLPSAKDYKRIGEGDTGLNTGGMGSISPVPFVDDEIMKKVIDQVVEPTIKGIRSKQMNYKGFVFFGLILVDGMPYVIEYNCRLGDPETQSVMMRLDSDLLELIDSVFDGSLDDQHIEMNPSYVSAVIAVSGGYPGAYEKGKKISLGDHFCFHAGTTRVGGDLLTSGGRVIAMMGKGDTLGEALEQSYDGLNNLHFDGINYRSDIGFDLKPYVQQ